VCFVVVNLCHLNIKMGRMHTPGLAVLAFTFLFIFLRTFSRCLLVCSTFYLKSVILNEDTLSVSLNMTGQRGSGPSALTPTGRIFLVLFRFNFYRDCDGCSSDAVFFEITV